MPAADSGVTGMGVTRIAMWSGPRNVSTAMLRSWGNRADTAVWDEPLYAHYLTRYTPDHPGIPEIIAAHESDWRKVVAGILGPVPGGRAIFYQKHIAHHMLPHIDDEWLAELSNAFLILAALAALPRLRRIRWRRFAPALKPLGLYALFVLAAVAGSYDPRLSLGGARELWSLATLPLLLLWLLPG